MASKQMAVVKRNEAVELHQPGEAAFTAILSEDIEWKPFAAFPPQARFGGGSSERQDYLDV